MFLYFALTHWMSTVLRMAYMDRVWDKRKRFRLGWEEFCSKSEFGSISDPDFGENSGRNWESEQFGNLILG